MIHGIGVDMVEIRRIQAGIDRFGRRLARRILSDSEYDIYQGKQRTAAYLAKRFAAKEALAKALGTGFRGDLLMGNISVANDRLGKPQFRYSRSLQTSLEEHGIIRSHLTITDEQDYALAYVILESR